MPLNPLSITANAISLYLDGSLHTAKDLIATAMKIENSEPKTTSKLRGYIQKMRNQLDVYLQQEWVSKHAIPTLGITGRAPADWRVTVGDIIKTQDDKDNDNILEITTGRMNEWASL